MDIALAMTPADPVATDPDLPLLERYRRAGDRAALEELLARHAEAAWRVALRLAGQPADAEDALQEAFIACATDAHRYAGRGSVRAWILAIAANAARRVRRAGSRRRHHEQRAAGRPPVPPEEAAPPTEQGVLDALAALPERYRAVLSLRFIDGLAVPDIAAALATPEKTVRTRIGRGIERLRALLLRRGLAVSAVAITAALAAQAGGQPALPATLLPTALAQAAAGATATVGGGLGAFAKLGLAAALAATVAGGGWWLGRSAPAAVAPDAVPADRGRDERGLLDQPVTLRVDAPVAVALERLLLALPVAGRPRLAVALPGGADWPRLRLAVEGQPLRTALDGLCTSGGLRWRASPAAVVIDRELPAPERQRLEAALRAGGPDVAEAARALAGAGDADALRTLLIALADPALADPALDALLRTLPGTGPGEVLAGSPLQLWAGDLAVVQAVTDAVRRLGPTRPRLLVIAGLVRATEHVDRCLALAMDGAADRGAHENARARDQRIATAQDAAEALGWFGDPRAVAPLMAQLEDSRRARTHHLVARAQCRALGRLADRAALPLLAAIAGERRDRDTAVTAIAGLAAFDDPLARQTLTAVLDDDGADDDRRVAAARSLARLGGDAARTALLRLAASVDDERLRNATVRALGWLEGDDVDALLARLLEDPAVGDAASEAIATGARGPTLLPLLATRLEQCRAEDYAAVAGAIAGLRTIESEAVLCARIPPDRVRLLGHGAALAAHGGERAQRALLALATDGQASIRVVAAIAVGQAGEAGLAVARRLAESDPEPAVRATALRSIPRPWREPTATWQRWLADGDAEVRLAALEILLARRRDFPRPFVAAALTTALADPAPRIRGFLVEVLPPRDLHALDPALWRTWLERLEREPEAAIRVAATRQAYTLVWPAVDVPREDVLRLVEALERLAERDASSRVRGEAMLGLFRLIRHAAATRGFPLALADRTPALQARLAAEPDAGVREALRPLLDPASDPDRVDFDRHLDPTPVPPPPRAAGVGGPAF